MKKNRSILQYFRETWEGRDGKPSGKRLLGIFLILFSCFLAFYGVKTSKDLSSVAILVTPFLAGGLGFWGITSYENIVQRKNTMEYGNMYGLPPDPNNPPHYD